MAAWFAFGMLAGAFIGGAVGFFAAALCAMAKDYGNVNMRDSKEHGEAGKEDEVGKEIKGRDSA